jgi:hypothetical protein
MSRLAGYGGNVYVANQVIQDCDDAWNEQVDGDVSLTLDETDYMTGTGSNKMVQAGALGVGDILASEVVSLPTLASFETVLMWAKSSVNINTADDYRVLLDNHAMCASPEVQVSLPVLVAGEWKFCRCPVVAGAFSAATAVISVGLKLQANDPGAATMHIDAIGAAREVVGIREWAIDEGAEVQDVSAFSDGQNKVFAVTQAAWSGTFSGFKDGAPLEIGTVIGLEFQESPTPTQMWRGSGIITNVGAASSVDGMVTYAYSFSGIHALERPTA